SGYDDAAVEGQGKAVAGQTFSEADLKREQASTKKKASARTPAPKVPTRSNYKKKPDAGVVRAPPSTAPSSFTAPPPTRGPTTMPPSTEPSPPATKLPPLRLMKQSNGTYTLEQMGKKKASNKAVDYFGRPIPEQDKMMPSLSKKKGLVKMSPPPSTKSVEGVLPNGIVAFPKQQKSHGYDAAVESLPATQPSGYDMGVDGQTTVSEKIREKTTVAPPTSMTTQETATVTKTVFSADEDLYGAASAGVQAVEEKEKSGYGEAEDAAVQAVTQSQSGYGPEDSAIEASATASAYGESEDAAVEGVEQEDEELSSTTPTSDVEETTATDEDDEVDTAATIDVRPTTEDAASADTAETDATPSTTAATTLAGRGGYEDAGVDAGSRTEDDGPSSTTVASAYSDEAVESSVNATDVAVEVEPTTASAVQATTSVFAARNPYGGDEEEDREVEVSVETTTRADEGSNSTGYGGADEEEHEEIERMLAEENSLLSSSTPSDVNATDVDVETTTHSAESTTEYLMNFEPKGDSVVGEIDEEEKEEVTTPADEAQNLDDDVTTMSSANETSTGNSLDDAELIHQVERAVERILGEEMAERTTTTTVKGPTVTSSPVKVLDKAPTLVHNRLYIKPQEAHRGAANSTTPQKGFVETCPPPHRCARNCFVFINDNGCQDCQCLWQSLPCETSEDCPEGAQYCDGGKCQCRPGYKQNMRKSGSCEIDESFQGVRSIGSHVKSDAAIVKERHQVKEQSTGGGYRRKRAALVKSFRDERLQWPGTTA
ncbi:hypothetical protein PENTCL1PPCAC_25553, partial [Pristionchus entomophagus]